MSRQGNASVKDAGNYQMLRGAEVQFHCPLTRKAGAFAFVSLAFTQWAMQIWK